MSPPNENAPQQRGVVVQFKPVGTGSANHNPFCTICGYVSRGKPLCYQCWCWTRSAQHISAAAALLRGVL